MFLNITISPGNQKKFFTAAGAQKAAAGFTMEKNKYNLFCSAVARLVTPLLKEQDLERTVEADVKISLAKLNVELVKKLETLEPFGIANPKPTFYSEVEILDSRTFGKNNDHLKLIVRDSPSQSEVGNYQLPIELITFGNANKYSSLTRGQKVNVVYSIEIDRWGGSEKLKRKLYIISIVMF